MDLDFGKWSSRLSRTGKEVGGRVKEAADVLMLRQKKVAAETKLYDLYAEIGKRYYAEQQENAQIPPRMKAAFLRVESLKKEIADKEAEILAMRGVRACPVCGSEVALKARFCYRCGAELPEEETLVQEEEDIFSETEEGDDFAAPEEETAEVTEEAPQPEEEPQETENPQEPEFPRNEDGSEYAEGAE